MVYRVFVLIFVLMMTIVPTFASYYNDNTIAQGGWRGERQRERDLNRMRYGNPYGPSYNTNAMQSGMPYGAYGYGGYGGYGGGAGSYYSGAPYYSYPGYTLPYQYNAMSPAPVPTFNYSPPAAGVAPAAPAVNIDIDTSK
jgi:hypothetical protein